MASSTSSRDLFDQKRQDWQRDPVAAFDAWLASQDLRRSSAEVYRVQWGRFLEWLALKRKTIMTVDTGTIAEFVASLEVKKPQRLRYLRLIERVLDHVREIELASTNPARFIAQDGEAAWRNARENEPTGFLTPAERAAIVGQLFSPLVEPSAAKRWRERRDRALVAIFLGGGLKTGDAIALTLDCVAIGSEWVTIEAANPAFTRVTRLTPFAVDVLGAWLEARRLAELPGQLVFPGSPSGRPMHKATVLRAIDALTEAAGVAQTRTERASPQTLRNTFAADLFERGVDIDQVGQWLGFLQPISAGRLHRAWKMWAEREASQHVSTQADEA
ncbi:tyrosine-type recombinase/integrase [Paraburkholderia silvatlantica]|uniref:Integrase n=1 Tax=Paraburkholderia silvatlantica TaxID=321895 RepID=A0A2U1AFU6_9BURK|nr:tyrosine-type recombinase/integrase [Paraburkholderia silvatlantica]MBB2928663.1 integrase [Paraburkholderia silvatlantica]PVY35249.1 phage integrase family protein [Paraburkholderia silvatlantica]PXW40891.1 phage integrase family protein [Paraburkholderia silvatlantica]PYE27358.1 phage integrase family protein [Paraburkholderia silvatlantica]TDQ98283.1 phage integrase family protein [Paraburkholderia silvatlantica]